MTLKDSGYEIESAPVKSFFEKRIKQVDYEMAKFFTSGNLLLSSYNKVEALRWWMRQKKLNPKRVVFVDDNIDNAYSMYRHFYQEPHVHSYWFTPPVTGREEKTVQESRMIFEDIARTQQAERRKNKEEK